MTASATNQSRLGWGGKGRVRRTTEGHTRTTRGRSRTILIACYLHGLPKKLACTARTFQGATPRGPKKNEPTRYNCIRPPVDHENSTFNEDKSRFAMVSQERKKTQGTPKPPLGLHPRVWDKLLGRGWRKTRNFLQWEKRKGQKQKKN